MAKKTKLELTWIGKEDRPRLEPRVLLEDPSKSYHAQQRVSEADLFDNRLIFGDNLLALKALEQEFAGQIKCIYIDPPYNTGATIHEHYDDGIEHSHLAVANGSATVWRFSAVCWTSTRMALFGFQIDDNELPALQGA